MNVEKEKATTNYSYTFFLDGNSTSTFHKIKSMTVGFLDVMG